MVSQAYCVVWLGKEMEIAVQMGLDAGQGHVLWGLHMLRRGSRVTFIGFLIF